MSSSTTPSQSASPEATRRSTRAPKATEKKKVYDRDYSDGEEDEVDETNPKSKGKGKARERSVSKDSESPEEKKQKRGAQTKTGKSSSSSKNRMEEVDEPAITKLVSSLYNKMLVNKTLDKWELILCPVNDDLSEGGIRCGAIEGYCFHRLLAAGEPVLCLPAESQAGNGNTLPLNLYCCLGEMSRNKRDVYDYGHAHQILSRLLRVNLFSWTRLFKTTQLDDADQSRITKDYLSINPSDAISTSKDQTLAFAFNASKDREGDEPLTVRKEIAKAILVKYKTNIITANTAAIADEAASLASAPDPDGLGEEDDQRLPVISGVVGVSSSNEVEVDVEMDYGPVPSGSGSTPIFGSGSASGN